MSKDSRILLVDMNKNQATYALPEFVLRFVCTSLYSVHEYSRHYFYESSNKYTWKENVCVQIVFEIICVYYLF